MKRLLFYLMLATALLGAVPAAEAKKKKYKYHGDHGHWGHGHHHHHRTRTIYVIENRRPVRRVVYIDDRGSYYRYVGGSRYYVRGRYFTSYPSRYYYADGRPRVGISINF